MQGNRDYAIAGYPFDRMVESYMEDLAAQDAGDGGSPEAIKGARRIADECFPGRQQEAHRAAHREAMRLLYGDLD